MAGNLKLLWVKFSHMVLALIFTDIFVIVYSNTQFSNYCI